MKLNALVLAAVTLLVAACGRGVDPVGADGKVSDLRQITGVYQTQQVPMSLMPTVAGTSITLTVTDTTIGLNGGCNTMSGEARVKDGRLAVDQLAMTEMGCEPPARMEQDTRLADLIMATPTLTLIGTTLTLTWPQGAIGFTRTGDTPPPFTGDPDAPVSSVAGEPAS